MVLWLDITAVSMVGMIWLDNMIWYVIQMWFQVSEE